MHLGIYLPVDRIVLYLILILIVTMANTLHSNRSFELDSIRGVAALMVFWGHLAGTMNIDRGLLTKLLTDGAAAVDMFFVLSGFVLSSSLMTKTQGYFSFITQRAFRIYPVYWLSIFLSVIMFHRDIDKISLAQHLALVTIFPFNTDYLGLPIWTIVIEMKVSLLLPFLIWFTSKHISFASGVLILLFTILLATISSRFPAIDWLRFLPLFTIGMLSYFWEDRFRLPFSTLSRSAFFGVLAREVLHK